MWTGARYNTNTGMKTAMVHGVWAHEDSHESCIVVCLLDIVRACMASSEGRTFGMGREMSRVFACHQSALPRMFGRQDVQVIEPLS